MALGFFLGNQFVDAFSEFEPRRGMPINPRRLRGCPASSVTVAASGTAALAGTVTPTLR